ncbi:helix-turn-helix domain-containing protein [Acidipropionibacterium acidipropionici]|uniref:helix-turn-helix domain-containing protein n=1 Tax=Acidipropionibacterium acidipropionici TaxID=1748 RepID=UPI00110A59A1|nr:helix-turn-helix domain-containing protein [Acidipropionibacterium acidipropionici]QCV93954.1 helix-turn-helix domain-containing protein [Acidipropionibacterium acidipropionici]
MPATVRQAHLTRRIDVDDATVEAARSSVDSAKGKQLQLVLRAADGTLLELPHSVERVLHQALSSLATTGSVRIERFPEELTTTTAAELLNVSRPTVSKWARDGRLDSFKVGSHTRFHREDVLVFKKKRDQERRAAFDELRSLDHEHIEEFDELG